ncbi:two-component sensor histidine kinase [Acidovorax sp. GW101-3H11]|uniref:sensor histidine kinase n=1 Tax=Acidovorax sp. GW101-3H11 TaxID=1813946 RepID=UPI0007B54200|nr:ATP-binding protein [Acidovorax sp. GW101-3H11]KZT14542.1 two-component sensor histidine kinase [Acidovorax sp. GW101-3H11]
MNSENELQTVEGLRAELARSQQQVADMAAAQEEFLRAVSHDLRAPLRHVTSYGTLVREVLGDLPPEVVQGAEVQEALGFLTTMDQSARRMGLMIDGLQALVRASRAPLRLQPVPLADAMAHARATLAPAEAGRSVEWHVDPDLPTLHADPVLLQELLVQLLGNALKFTGPVAQPRITVRADAAPTGSVAFTLQDNGVGFDPARAGALFGVFQRLHRETEFDGVGAGLALCRAIAQRHGAAVAAMAAPGAGCTVRVAWPVVAAAAAAV